MTAMAPMPRVTALAAGAYFQRAQIYNLGTNGQAWVGSHLQFVGALWKEAELEERLNKVVELDDQRKRHRGQGVGFHWCAFSSKVRLPLKD